MTKRLLFLSTVYPTPWEPHKGPANARLIGAMRRLGYSVSVIAPVPWVKWRPGNRLPRERGAEYPVFWYPPGIWRHRYHDWMRWSVGRAVERAITSGPPVSAILAFWTHPDGTTAIDVGKRHGIPVGIIAGGSDVMLLANDPARRPIIGATLRDAAHVFAIGSEIGRRVTELGVSPSQVSTYLRGVDLRHFSPGDRTEARRSLGLSTDAPLLLWVGNMVHVKAPERVIGVTRALEQSFPGIHLAMIGDGPMRQSLQRMALESGALGERILFPGSLGESELARWYRAANVFVLPSRSEGIPNVLVEAMASGLPFVASRVGGIPDLLPFGCSAAVPEGDLEAMTAAITTVLTAADHRLPANGQFDILAGARHVAHQLRLEAPE